MTGRKWWDFARYDPRMPESHQLLIIRVHRDEEFIKRLESAVIEAEKLAGEILSQLLGMNHWVEVDSVQLDEVMV